MNTETRRCQNCKASFEIDAQDFAFYEKMQVPAPTFCPQCRFQRRVMFRNERTLYKRSCSLCGASIISVFASDKPYAVYCGPCWWSDKWDGEEYAIEYDPEKNFFEQFRKLQQRAPFMSLVVSYDQLVNSEYTNHAGNLKNCYLVFDTGFGENILYSTVANYSKDSADCLMIDACELCYESINCEKCSRTCFSEDCLSCHNVYFSKNLSGCSDCTGCINLRNKQYCIFNEQYTKEEYEKRTKEFKFDSHEALSEFRARSYAFWGKYPRRYMHGTHNKDVTGDYINESKNLKVSYLCRGAEDGKYCQRISMKPARDIYDYTEWGDGAQSIVDCVTSGEGVDTMKFCYGCWRTPSTHVEYSMFTLSSQNCFGCVNMRKKQYCILNRQYSKEEYVKLRERIIRDMNERPYVDSMGRVWKYGDFFPYDLSLFDYNESTAAQYFPIARDAVLRSGWRWREKPRAQHEITRAARDLPDNISDTGEEIIGHIIGCDLCGGGYRIIPAELAFLRRFSFPIPRVCSECRHSARMQRTNLPRVWNSSCSHCGKEMITSYDPAKKEIVYCETCYQTEVV